MDKGTVSLRSYHQLILFRDGEIYIIFFPRFSLCLHKADGQEHNLENHNSRWPPNQYLSAGADQSIFWRWEIIKIILTFKFCLLSAIQVWLSFCFFGSAIYQILIWRRNFYHPSFILLVWRDYKFFQTKSSRSCRITELASSLTIHHAENFSFGRCENPRNSKGEDVYQMQISKCSEVKLKERGRQVCPGGRTIHHLPVSE